MAYTGGDEHEIVDIVYSAEEERASLRLACGGHPRPLLLRADGSAQAIGAIRRLMRGDVARDRRVERAGRAFHHDAAVEDAAAMLQAALERDLVVVRSGADVHRDHLLVGSVTESLLTKDKGYDFIVANNDDMILGALIDAGLDAPFSCRQGICGACACQLTSGEVEMAHNEVLEEGDLAEGYILACQALALTPGVSITY